MACGILASLATVMEGQQFLWTLEVFLLLQSVLCLLAGDLLEATTKIIDTDLCNHQTELMGGRMKLKCGFGKW